MSQDISDLIVGSGGPAPSAQPQDISDLVTGGTPTATTGQQFEAGLESGAREFTRTGAMTAGAITGLKLTAPTMNPLIMGAGFIGGGTLGYMAGEQAAQGMGLRSAEQMPPAVRPGAYAGESFGGSAGVLLAPYAGAATKLQLAGTNIVSRFFNSAILAARTQPAKLAALEAAPAASAALGAFGAESVAPGSTGIRMGAEITMGLLNPVSIATGTWNTAAKLITSVQSRLSGEAIQNQSFRQIADLVEATGGDLDLVLKVLEQTNPELLRTGTVAQLSGDPTISAIQEMYKRRDGTFAREVDDKFEKTMDLLRVSIGALEQTGDAGALKAAAELRSQFYNTLIHARVDRANREAVQKLAKLKGADIPASEVSRIARESLEGALDQSRAVERELWSKIKIDETFQVDNLRTAVDEIYSKSAKELRGEKIPASVISLLNRASEVPPPTTTRIPGTFDLVDVPSGPAGVSFIDLQDFRSKMLESAREASRAGRNAEATRLGQLAEAILDDIDAVMGKAGNKAYDEARAYTRQLNDVFTRSYAGQALAEGRYGDRIPAEVLLRRATAGGDEAAMIRLDDLTRATRFLDEMNLGDAFVTAENIKLMNDAQDQFMRILATSGVDKNGRINVDKLRDFASKRPELMARFPGVKADLDDAIKGGESLIRWQQMADTLNNAKKLSPMTRIAGSDAVAVSRDAILSKSRDKDIANLAKFARGGATDKRGVQVVTPQAAMQDLRGSMIQAVQRIATRDVPNQGPTVDLAKFKSVMFDTPVAGGSPLATLLVKEGVFDQGHIDRVSKFLNAAETAAKSQRPSSVAKVPESMLDKITRLSTRFIGAVGGALGRRATGGPGELIVAGGTADFAQDILMRIPAANQQAMMMKLISDPQMLLEVSKRPMNQSQARQQAGRFYAWAIQSGLTTGIEASRPTYEQEPASPTLFSQPR